MKWQKETDLEPKIELGKSVKISIWSSVRLQTENSVQHSIKDPLGFSIWGTVWCWPVHSVWSVIWDFRMRDWK